MATDTTTNDLEGWTRVVTRPPSAKGYRVVERWMKQRTAWCREPEQPGLFDYGFKDIETFAFYFSDPNTAVAFRLRWC